MATPPIIHAAGAPTQPAGVPVVAAGHVGLEARTERVTRELLALIDDLRAQAAPADVPVADSALAVAAFLSAGLNTLVMRSRKRATTIRPRPDGS